MRKRKRLDPSGIVACAAPENGICCICGGNFPISASLVDYQSTTYLNLCEDCALRLLLFAMERRREVARSTN